MKSIQLKFVNTPTCRTTQSYTAGGRQSAHGLVYPETEPKPQPLAPIPAHREYSDKGPGDLLEPHRPCPIPGRTVLRWLPATPILLEVDTSYCCRLCLACLGLKRKINRYKDPAGDSRSGRMDGQKDRRLTSEQVFGTTVWISKCVRVFFCKCLKTSQKWHLNILKHTKHDEKDWELLETLSLKMRL